MQRDKNRVYALITHTHTRTQISRSNTSSLAGTSFTRTRARGNLIRGHNHAARESRSLALLYSQRDFPDTYREVRMYSELERCRVRCDVIAKELAKEMIPRRVLNVVRKLFGIEECKVLEQTALCGRILPRISVRL